MENARRLEKAMPQLSEKLSEFAKQSPLIYQKLLEKRLATADEMADIIAMAKDISDALTKVQIGLVHMCYWAEAVNSVCVTETFVSICMEAVLEAVHEPIGRALEEMRNTGAEKKEDAEKGENIEEAKDVEAAEASEMD